MHRFFADDRGVVNGAAWLGTEDSRHALRVLRLEAGDDIELVSAPERYLARIENTDGECVAVRIMQTLRSTEARTRVTLYQGLPKADKMELIVQKATELGAYEIAAFPSSRCVLRLDAASAAK